MGAVKIRKKDTGVGYITKGFLQDIKRELNVMGEKTRPLSAIKNLNLETLRSQFNNLLNLAREDYKETVNNEDAKLPREYFDILRRSYAEQLLSTENLNPYSGEDWSTIVHKTAEQYDTKVSDLIKNSKDDEQNKLDENQIIDAVTGQDEKAKEDEERRKEEEKVLFEKQQRNALNAVVESDIYFDIINAIASKSTGGSGGQRFYTAKYTYLYEGTGDLINPLFRELISPDDLYALGQLAEVYKTDKGFTHDELYLRIKDRVVQAGLRDLQNKGISIVQQEPTEATFDPDF